MLQFITSPIIFFVSLSLFTVGGVGSLLIRKNDELANLWSSFFAVAGSALGLIFSTGAILSGQNLFYALGAPIFPIFAFSFHFDLLANYFIFIISFISFFCSIYGAGYAKHYYKKYSIGALGFFYNLFIAVLYLVVASSNGLFFLISWELMSVLSYFLVVYDHNDKNNVKAGTLYLVMTYAGTAFITLSFLFLYKYTGSFDFAVIKSNIAAVPLAVKNTIFIFVLIGLGAKSGIIPFHIWLPAAHPAAPSHVSALMSGVMIKIGIYMMIRLFLDLLQPAPAWWGMTVLVVGSVSALLGVLYALTEHDIKRLLAYHSIENIGIILLGLGSALVFYSFNMPSLALIGLAAALFHTINHAIFKSLLFLSAGAVINETHTRNMEEYGGLIKYMPMTALFFLIGAMAISALPLFNGFWSEWLTFQALFQGISQLQSSVQWIFILSGGALAFTGGLALACFVKAFGSIFLGRSRSPEVAECKECSMPMQIGMGGLAVSTLLFGLFSGSVIIILEKIGRSFSVSGNAPSFIRLSSYQSLNIKDSFSSASAPMYFAFLSVAVLIIFLVVRYAINKTQKIKIGKTWNCGTDLTPRMEITSTGFARSIVMIFKGVLKPSVQHDIEYHDAETRYMPKSRAVTFSLNDLYHSYLYNPIHTAINSLSIKMKNIQGGNVNIYISYIFIALVISLISIL
ncbi:MAG: proton-conducting transporter membrane subunit [Candidatus Paceibacterota bacterium]